jgi:hypothetical protein
MWYGLGLVLGAAAGYSIAFFRLRWMEKHLDRQVFCKGTILQRGKGDMPSAVVYSRKAGAAPEPVSAAGGKEQTAAGV